MYILWSDSSKKRKNILILTGVRISLSGFLISQFPEEEIWSSVGPVILWTLSNPKDKLSAMKCPWVNFREISQEKGLHMFMQVQCWERSEENAGAALPEYNGLLVYAVWAARP